MAHCLFGNNTMSVLRGNTVQENLLRLGAEQEEEEDEAESETSSETLESLDAPITELTGKKYSNGDPYQVSMDDLDIGITHEPATK